MLEILNVKSLPAATSVRLAILSLLALSAGCSSLDMSGDAIDYRGAKVKTQPLVVPPDLTQLARDSRYQPQGGVISAAAASTVAPATGTAAAAATPTVALKTLDGMRIERAGQDRWLVVPMSPEQLWPQLRSFWTQIGFTLVQDDAKAGVMETNWSENRAKLPADIVRNMLGRLAGNLWDTGERDQFRTRVERTTGGTEIYVAHRGVEEVFTGERRESTTWRARPSDTQLEAEMLSRLMVSLGAPAQPARAQVAATTATGAGAVATAAAPEGPARARAVANGTALEVDDPFDRAWRRVGLALDRTGFTVEDRDRNLGLYYVRYVDPKSIGKEAPGFWARLLGDTNNPLAAVRYRIAIKGNGDKSVVAVMSSAGVVEVGDAAKRISALLVAELR